MRLCDIGEFGLISTIKGMVSDGEGVLAGIGDDAAVITISAGKVVLITSDILHEGVDFELRYTEAYLLGRKAVAVSLSDLAACGGRPRAFLTSIALTPDTEVGFVEELYKGMLEEAGRFGISLVGGDTSKGGALVIAIVLLGEADVGEIVYRRGARVGDLIFVTGTLGDAALGLVELKKGGKGELVRRHLAPTPRVAAGYQIARRGLATAMIDISDGLVADLHHLAEASGVGGKLWLSSIPLSEDYQREVKEYTEDPYLLALTGGEDYELLFTSPPERSKEIVGVAREIGIPITQVGEVVSADMGVRIYKDDGTEYRLEQSGYDHFRV